MITVLEATEQVTTIPEGLANTALGMGTVFAVLILISFIIYLLKFVPAEDLTEYEAIQSDPLDRKGKEKVAEEKVQVQKPVQQETVPVQNTDNSELIAVIAAAVAAQMSEETGIAVAPDGLVIRSIKKRVFS